VKGRQPLKRFCTVKFEALALLPLTRATLPVETRDNHYPGWFDQKEQAVREMPHSGTPPIVMNHGKA
jgi:hypothetical protein